MSKFKIATASNVIFVGIVSYLAVYAIAIYYSRSIAASMILSCVFATAAICLYLFIFSVKDAKTTAKAESTAIYEKLKIAIAVLPKDKYAYFAKKTLSAKGKPFDEKNGIIYFDGFKLAFAAEYPETGENSLFKQISESNGENTALFGISFTENARNFAKAARGVRLIDLNDVFDVLISDEELASYGFAVKKEKFKIRDFIFIFNAKTARKTAFYGVVLLFTAKFVIFPLWYIICGTAFLFFSLFQVFFAKRE